MVGNIMAYQPKENEHVVRNASDLSGTLDSTIVYLIDGSVDMGTQNIEVPSTGLNIRGYGFGISELTSSEDNYTMFTTPSGGNSGDLFLGGLEITTSGTSSKVFDLDNDGNSKAVEMTTVNFNSCTSLGEIKDYRQGLELNTGRFGGTPTLTLTGTWSGGYRITTSIVRSLSSGMTGSLFEAGTGFSMSSRFLTDINCDLPASASFADFSSSNFPNPSTLQVRDAIFTRNGSSDPTDTNIFPNISHTALPSLFRDNQGIENTFVGGRLKLTTESTTTVSASDTWYTLAGTWTSSDVQHFDSPSNGQLRNLGTNPVEFSVSGEISIECNQNRVLQIRLRRYNSSTDDFTELTDTELRRTVNALSGARDIAIFSFSNTVRLLQNDYIYIQVNNNTDTNNVTCELDSYWFVQRI